MMNNIAYTKHQANFLMVARLISDKFPDGMLILMSPPNADIVAVPAAGVWRPSGFMLGLGI
jgi:hypothetical protein